MRVEIIQTTKFTKHIEKQINAVNIILSINAEIFSFSERQTPKTKVMRVIDPKMTVMFSQTFQILEIVFLIFSLVFMFSFG